MEDERRDKGQRNQINKEGKQRINNSKKVKWEKNITNNERQHELLGKEKR